MTNIGEKIKELREEKGITQRELAGKTSLPIAAIEHGVYNPRVSDIKRIAIELGVNYNLILYSTENISIALDEWQEYKKIGLTPDQIREMDVMYLEKCKQVNSLVKKCEELERRANERN